jgi:hypothetical protein
MSQGMTPKERRQSRWAWARSHIRSIREVETFRDAALSFVRLMSELLAIRRLLADHDWKRYDDKIEDQLVSEIQQRLRKLARRKVVPLKRRGAA